MNVLRPVQIGSAGALSAVAAESLQSVESGLVVLERGFAAGDALVDLIAIDARRRLVVVIVEVNADTAAVVRALEAAAWCRERGALLGRLFARADIDPSGPIRSLVVARHLSERALRLLRALGPVAPAALECQVFDLNGERCVYYEPVDQAAWRDEGLEDRRSDERSPAVSPESHAAASGGRLAGQRGEPAELTSAERARSMIDRLETLKFRQAFEP